MTAPTPTAASSAEAYPLRWKALAFLGIAQFMLIIDVTVVAIALPHMSVDLALGREATTWVVTGYTLAFGGLMLLGGRLADLLGPRRVIYAGLTLFALASLTAGLANTGEVLLVGRVAQGVGAALLSPAALSAVVRIFDGDERNRALGIWSALGGGGAAVGVLLGGVLTAGPGWAWVFYVNVPIAAIVLLSLVRLLPELPAAGRIGGIDVPGAALVTAATGIAIYALIGAGEHGWGAGRTWSLLGASVVLYLAFALRQRTAEVPLMDLGLLARRPVSAGTFLMVVTTALMVSVFFLGTFYLQHYVGYGALTTGLLFLPIALATMAGATAGGRVIGRLGGRRLAVVGFAVAAGGFAVPVAVDGAAAVVAGVTVAGLGLGSLFVAASATALGQIGPAEAGIASGIVSTFHELGASLGVAVISSVAAASLVGTTAVGFERGFTLAVVLAVVSGLIAAVLVPAPARPTVPTGEPI